MKGPVSYDQRTTTLKGVEKVNDMIGEGQEAISSKTYLSAIGQKFLIPKLKNVKMSKSNYKNRFILIIKLSK
jgi:hypothetical protein